MANQTRVVSLDTHQPVSASAAPLLQRVALPNLGKFSRAEQAPPIVHEVLQSMGQPLNLAQRAALEPRFGHDFSRVRLHLDHHAARSARAVDAQAYTVGRHIVFGEGQFAPHTPAGLRLLAHELTHVVQQGALTGSLPRRLPIGPLDSPQEEQAERRAASLKGLDRLTSLPLHWPAIQRSGVTPASFPGFSQGDYVTCGAASLVSAMIIWDKEKKDPKAPNELVVNACNLALSYLAWNHASLVKAWDDRKVDGEKLFEENKTSLTTIRDAARLPGSKLSEADYQSIALVFYSLHYDGRPGLSKDEIGSLTKLFGLGKGAADSANSFDDIMKAPTLTGLKPGQIAQVHWWVRTSKPDAEGRVNMGKHAFLIGRFKEGKWFLSDQGTKPPTELQADDLPGLKSLIVAASASDTYWLHTGGMPMYATPAGPMMMLTPGFTGVVLLGERGGVEKETVQGILKPGEYLGELDAGALTWGDKLTSWDFLERQYTLIDAKKALGPYGTGHGGLIVEMPEGVFNLYKTNLVKEANLEANSLDASGGGLLVKPKRFYHAWLLPCASLGCKSHWIQVY